MDFFDIIFWAILIGAALSGCGVLKIKLSNRVFLSRTPRTYYAHLENVLSPYSSIKLIEQLLNNARDRLKKEYKWYQSYKADGSLFKQEYAYWRVMFDTSPDYFTMDLWATCFILAYLEDNISKGIMGTVSDAEYPVVKNLQSTLKEKYQQKKETNPDLAAVVFYEYSHHEIVTKA